MQPYRANPLGTGRGPVSYERLALSEGGFRLANPFGGTGPHELELSRYFRK